MDGLTLGLLLPLAGTTLGAACVFSIRRRIPDMLNKLLTGFAAGVMVAASVWSLLIPAIESGPDGSFLRVVPAAAGFIAGMAFLLVLDIAVPHQHINGSLNEGPKSGLSRTTKLIFAVTMHNIPEGMAIGVSLAAAMENNAYIPMAGALALSAGIALQNIPEGAIVSMPLRAAGNSRRRAFVIGCLSGVVEPVAAALAVWLTVWTLPLLPYMLAFAAGAMMYVVVEELIPETQEGRHSNMGTVGFTAGFVLMMMLDVALG